MDIITVLAISTGLAMDCFAVSISAGACNKKFTLFNTLKIALMFGFFQAAMTLAGWLGGTGFLKYVEKFSGIIAFALLLIIGIRMIVESFKKEEEKNINYCSTKVLAVLAIATSIDALAAGISFSFLKSAPVFPVIAIGAASFIFSLAGVYAGKKTGELLGSKAELAGGVILIVIGAKTLIENLAG